MEISSLSDITEWLGDMNEIDTQRTYNPPSFWKPYHFATIALKAKILNSNINLPEAQIAYAARMGLWEAIGQNPPITVTKYPTKGRFLEAHSISHGDDVHELSIKVADMFKCCARDSDTVDSIQVLMAELLGNCCAHSSYAGHDVFGLVCGQSWPRGNLAQICIADCGMGIRNSLLNNTSLAERLQTENACELATEYGVTGKPFGSHSGYGLTVANDLISKCGGHLSIFSNSEYYHSRPYLKVSGPLPQQWQGTLLVIEWNLQSTLQIKDVYDAWPVPSSISEEDYDELFN